MDKKLRLIAGQIVVESKMSKSAKIQLLNFIKEASDIQIKSFILNKKIIKLDEQSEQIVNERFEISEAGAGLQLVVAGGIVATALAAEYLHRFLSKAYKQCAPIKDKGGSHNQYKMCIFNAKIRGSQKLIQLYKSNINKCKVTKNPDKCKNKLMKNIEKEQAKIVKFNKLIQKWKI